MSLTGFNSVPATHPPKLARELKVRIGELFDRYDFDEVMTEIAKQKPKHDIYICAHGLKRRCPNCGVNI